MFRRFCLIALIVCAPLTGSVAQVQRQTAPVTFDVVSVRPSATGIRRPIARLTADGISESDNPLIWLLAAVFNLPLEEYLVNVPSWASSTRYDIQAKVNEADAARFQKLSYDQQWALLQPVFAERFHLQFHRELRPFPIYSLRVARGGAHLQLTPEGIETSVDIQGRYTLRAQGLTMRQFSSMLSSEVPGEPRDATGLAGRYNITLHWSRQSLASDGEASSDVDIFKALREQLGLELTKGTEPVSVVVIDRLDRPDGN